MDEELTAEVFPHTENNAKNKNSFPDEQLMVMRRSKLELGLE